MSKAHRRKQAGRAPQNFTAPPLPPRAEMTAAELRQMIGEEIDKRIHVAPIEMEPAKPLPDAQTDAAPSLTVPVGLGLPAPQAASETRTSNATPPVQGFEPSDIEAALRRSPAFKEAPPSPAQIAEEAETYPAPESRKDAEPTPTAGNSIAVAPSHHPRWAKDIGEILFWIIAAPAAAVVLGLLADITVVAAIDFWPAVRAIVSLG